MIRSKKGDLAISTNAIVVLIIAVIMLGLIIGFVTRGFGAVSDKFFGEVEKLPEPPRASGSEPITASELTLVRQGAQFGTKIAVFNTGENTATAVKPEISCGTTDIVISQDAKDTQVNEKDIPSKEAETFIFMSKIQANAPEGKQLCKLKATLTAAAGPAGSETNIDLSQDIIIEVRK